MAETFIVTKFLIPAQKPHTIERPQLLRKLRLGMQHKLILISAPPGFGKTTLLAGWLNRNKTPCAWLSLEEQDDMPLLFVRYLIASIQRVLPGFGETILTSLNSLPQPPISSVFAALSNELLTITQPLVIALDDLQCIQNASIHHGLIFIIDHLPSSIHFCVATRQDPPWKIAHMRSQQTVLEIRTDDLRFDPAETARFLEKTITLTLNRDDLKTLVERTEGWVVALQMSATSLLESNDTHAFIHSFAGSHRLVVDYLSEEVLNRQDSATRDFLVRSSLLEHLNPSLCNTALERRDGFEMIAFLEKANLFLKPIDESQKWYSFHPLFHELLQHQAELMDPAIKRQVHRNASMWFLAHDDALNSLRHATKAGDSGIAANIAEQNSLRFLDQGRISEVSGWLASLPAGLISRWPWLLISRAWVDLYMGRISRLESLLKQAIDRIEEIHHLAKKQRLLGHMHAVRAHASLINGKLQSVLEYANQALELLPPEDGMARSHTHIALGDYWQATGDPGRAAQAYELAVTCAQEAGIEHLRVLSLGYLANVLSMRGRENEHAEKICRQLLDEYPTPAKRRSLPALAFPMASLSQLLVNRGEFLNALVLCEEAVALSRYWQQADTLRFTLTVLSNILICLNDTTRAQTTFLEARLMAETPSGWYAPSLTFLEMQYHMVTGDLAPVRRWSQAQKFDFSDINHHADWYILFARLLVKEGEYARAVEFLQRLIDHFSDLDVPFQVATLLGDQACAYHGLGEMDKALENVSKLVDFGRIELAAVPIYRKGPAMMSLLKSALARGIKADRVRKLLDAIYTLFPQTGESRADGGQFLPQHLTEREVDVLKLLDSGRSSKAIAKELDIAPSTVRTHIKSIYNKLGVNHRIEALHKAKALKII